MKKSLGFSLIEIMVALAISTILLAGVLSIFNMSKSTYTIQSSLAELQDNARFLINNLTNELRVVGYLGCREIDTYNNPFFVFNGINDVPIANTDPNLFPPSDLLVFDIDKSVQQELMLTMFNNSIDETVKDIPLAVNSNILPSTGGRIGIRNCSSNDADYYQATTNPANNVTTIIAPSEMVKSYVPPIDLFMTGTASTSDSPTSSILYEVRADSDNGEFGLYRTIDYGGNQSLNTLQNPVSPVERRLFVEGVQNMQIRYGIDINSDKIPERYTTVPSSNINEPTVSIRITALMMTTKKKGITCPFNKSFILDQNIAEYTPTRDGYCHRLFTTTIGIRNGMFPF